MARHGHISAKDADAIVRAQCSGKHDPPARGSGSKSSGGGIIHKILKVTDHVGRS